MRSLDHIELISGRIAVGQLITILARLVGDRIRKHHSALVYHITDDGVVSLAALGYATPLQAVLDPADHSRFFRPEIVAGELTIGAHITLALSTARVDGFVVNITEEDGMDWAVVAVQGHNTLLMLSLAPALAAA